MSGVPAGFEGDSDDDFMYDDYTHEHKVISPPVNVENVPSVSENHANIGFGKFSKIKDTQLLEEEISLNSEDVRVAILNKNKEFVERALDKGFNTETAMQAGWTALIYAANNGLVEIVKLLLDRKASPNFQKDMFTPLISVCLSTKRNEDELVSCAKLLIEYGAKVNVHDRHLMTPVMYAAKQGYSKLVKILCENDADINKQETRGWTAICFASSNGFSHVVRVLLDFKAEINITTFDGQRATDIAFSNGYSMLSELLDKYDGNTTDQFSNVPVGISSLKSSTSSKYVKYGDLELFLYGLELGHLVPLLQEHQLELKDLLKMTEEEMTEIGVTQLGVRKKLLNAIRDVHTNEWDMKSLSVENMTKLTILETAAIVANITKHLKCIQSSVSYLKRHLQHKKHELAAESANLQVTLLDQCAEAVQISTSMQRDIKTLNNDAILMFPNCNQKPVDLIEKESTGKISTTRIFIFFGVATFVGGSIFMGYKLKR